MQTGTGHYSCFAVTFRKSLLPQGLRKSESRVLHSLRSASRGFAMICSGLCRSFGIESLPARPGPLDSLRTYVDD